MKVGTRVVYIDAKDGHHTATVTAVTGAGKSGYKTLDLRASGIEEPVMSVPHGNDEEGGGYWYLAGEKPDVRPKPVAKKKKA